MNKNNLVIKTVIFSLLVTSTIGSILLIPSSGNCLSKEKGEIKNQIASLGEEIKTEKEYRTELQEFIEGCRAGLEDSKKDQRLNYQKSRQIFIEKMENKLNNIEAEMKANDKVSNETNNFSDESPSKRLLERLLDRSDVDN